MKVYIYDWHYIVQNDVTYYIGFGITDDDKRVSVINSAHMKSFYAQSQSLEHFLRHKMIVLEQILPSIYHVDLVSHKLLRKDIEGEDTFYKIDIMNVDKSRELADLLKANRVKVYEDEIDPITEFLNRNDFNFTGWYEIESAQIFEEGLITYNSEYYVNSKQMKVIDYEKVPIMRIMSMDIETYSSSEFAVPLAHNPLDEVRVIGTVMKYGTEYIRKAFVLANIEFNIDNVEVEYYLNQEDLIKGYINHLRVVKPEIVVGFNHMSYDYAFLVDRYILTSQDKPSYSLIRNHRLRAKHIVWTNTAFNTTDLWMIECPGVIDIDIMQYSIKEQSFKGYSLNEVAKQVVGETKIDLDHHLMHTYFANNDIEGIAEIVRYCIQDCELPIKIFERNLVQVGIMERAKVERILANSIYTMGSAARMIGQLHYECKGKYLLDTSSEQRVRYEGATVLDPKKGLYEHCATVDFTSLYPSIIISENICYSTYVAPEQRVNADNYNWIKLGDDYVTFRKSPMGIIPSLLVKLIDQRKVAKSKMKSCPPEDVKVWDKRQWAYKIVANSIYGLMGSHDKHLMFQRGAECVTSMGRFHLQTARSTLETQPGVTVFYGDTDSCFIQIDGLADPDSISARCKELCKVVNAAMQHKVSLEHENSFRKMIIQGKKNYMAQWYTGGIYYRGGQAVRKNSSAFLKQLLLDLVNHIFNKDIEFVKKFIDDKREQLIKGNVSIDEIKIGMLINDSVIKKEFVPMVKHMDDNGILYKPNQRIHYVYIIDHSSSHTAKRRNADWVKENNVPIDYYAHYTYEVHNPLYKLIDILNI